MAEVRCNQHRPGLGAIRRLPRCRTTSIVRALLPNASPPFRPQLPGSPSPPCPTRSLVDPISRPPKNPSCSPCSSGRRPRAPAGRRTRRSVPGSAARSARSSGPCGGSKRSGSSCGKRPPTTRPAGSSSSSGWPSACARPLPHPRWNPRHHRRATNSEEREKNNGRWRVRAGNARPCRPENRRSRIGRRSTSGPMGAISSCAGSRGRGWPNSTSWPRRRHARPPNVLTRRNTLCILKE
jgi:hypothetical protein